MKSTALNNILVAIHLSEPTSDIVATAIMLNNTHSGNFWVVYADDSAPYFYAPESGNEPGLTFDTQHTDADVVLAGIREQLS